MFIRLINNFLQKGDGHWSRMSRAKVNQLKFIKLQHVWIGLCKALLVFFTLSLHSGSRQHSPLVRSSSSALGLVLPTSLLTGIPHFVVNQRRVFRYVMSLPGCLQCSCVSSVIVNALFEFKYGHGFFNTTKRWEFITHTKAVSLFHIHFLSSTETVVRYVYHNSTAPNLTLFALIFQP